MYFMVCFSALHCIENAVVEFKSPTRTQCCVIVRAIDCRVVVAVTHATRTKTSDATVHHVGARRSQESELDFDRSFSFKVTLPGLVQV